MQHTCIMEEKIIYKFEFDNVNDDIFIEPDINQYEPYIKK